MALRLWISAAALWLLSGCVDESDQGEGDATTLEKRLIYEERVPTDDGLSDTLHRRPARGVLLEVLDADGRVVSTVATDEEGRFAAPEGRRIRAVSMSVDPTEISVVSSVGVPYRVEVSGDEVVIPAADAAQTSGAFNILDVARQVTARVAEATGLGAPPVTLTWELGNVGRTALGLPVYTSFYARDDATPIIVIEGGVAGEIGTTSTAHFDDHVIAHEMGHFIQDNLAFDASMGGSHNANNLYYSLAFSEGFATWLACAVLDDPRYISTVGQPPSNQLNYSNYTIENADNIPGRAYGNDSELTVSEVLWDLYDGSEGYPEDADGDGVALPFAAIFQALPKKGDGEYTYLASVLTRLESEGAVTRQEITALLTRPTDQNVPYPPQVDWPFWMVPGETYVEVLGLPEEIADMDASLYGGSFFWNHFYELGVEQNAQVSITLDVDPFDFDPGVTVDLHRNDNTRIDQFSGPPYPATLTTPLSPGSYILHVSASEHASYRLGYRVE